MGEGNKCSEHSGFDSRLDRCEKDIQAIFKKFESTGKTAWAFVGTAILALLSMGVNFFMFLKSGGQ